MAPEEGTQKLLAQILPSSIERRASQPGEESEQDFSVRAKAPYSTSCRVSLFVDSALLEVIPYNNMFQDQGKTS